jgi:hypothetical protein
VTTARQDALIAQIRTARTKAERRAAARQFQHAPAVPEAPEARAALNRDLGRFILARRDEFRAAGEATNSAGGYLAPPAFSDEVIRLLREWDSVIADCEDLVTSHGQSWKRPQISSFTASGAALSENTAATDATSTLISFAGQQSFGITPTYAALLSASLQLIQDAIRQDLSDGKAGGWNPLGSGAPPVYSGVPTGNGDLVSLLASAAAESLGRQVASAGSTALYAAATTGQEASLGTLTPANLAKLIAVVDAAYIKMGCKFYMSSADAATVFGTSGVLANAGSLSLFGFPVEITNAATNWSTGTVSGPVFGRLDRFMTLRRVNGVTAQVLKERFADALQVAVLCHARMDFAARGEPTALAYSK